MGSSITTIYCDGVFDLFHRGHLEHFRSLKNEYKNVRLIVGVISDSDTASYKNTPIMYEKNRALIINLCKFVDVCIPNSPLILTENFLLEHKIDYVYHAFADPNDENKQCEFFTVPKKLGIFKTIPYIQKISSSEIKKSHDWEYIWRKKGNETTNDLRLLSGYEDTDYDPESSWTRLRNEAQIINSDSVLEVGCGAGYMAQYIKKTNDQYVGVEQSLSLVNKHLDILGNAVIAGEANNLPFKDKSVDHIVCIGVFQYFPSKQYMLETLAEFERVARKSIYIGSIRLKSHTVKPNKHKYTGPTQHFTIGPEEFPKTYIRLAAFYDSDNYYNIIKFL